jgi:predicted metal-binding transcription factor (methanogenesis marker protein 9)
MLEDIAVGLDDGDRKIAGETVACKLWQGCVLVNSRFWGVSKDQSSYLGEKEETTDSTFDDNWSQVCGSLVVIMPSTKQCMNEERTIRKDDVAQAQGIQLKRNSGET